MRVVSEKYEETVTIEAFPVFNPEASKILPRCIELEYQGIGIEQRVSKTLKNYSGHTFNFEFRFTKPHEHIEIRPLKGVVPGHSSIEVDFLYTPTKKNLDHADAELYINEHNFTPINFKIMIFPSLKGKTTNKEMMKTKQISADEKYLNNEAPKKPIEEEAYSMNEIYRDENLVNITQFKTAVEVSHHTEGEEIK